MTHIRDITFMSEWLILSSGVALTSGEIDMWSKCIGVNSLNDHCV